MGQTGGFIKKHNEYRLAPVFDNGACLFPNLTDEDEMKNIIILWKKQIRGFLRFQLLRLN
jgi:hypothetical protein